jgi:hypothetical protein
LDDDYRRQPSDFATVDVVADADGTWQRELHHLLAVHGAFAARHAGEEHPAGKGGEGERQARRIQSARRALELPVAALALALMLVVLAALAVEATPLLGHKSSAARVPTVTPTPIPTATLVPTSPPTPPPRTVVVKEAWYSITLPYDWFPGPVQPIVINGQVTGYFQQVTGPLSLGAQLQVSVFPNYTSTLQNFFSAFAISDIAKESAVQQVTLSGSPCLRKDLDRYTDPQGNPQQPLEHIILLGCLHGGRAYEFQFSLDANDFQAASQLYLNAMLASIILLD